MKPLAGKSRYLAGMSDLFDKYIKQWIHAVKQWPDYRIAVGNLECMQLSEVDTK